MDSMGHDAQLQAEVNNLHARRMEWLRSLTLLRLLRHIQSPLFILEAQTAADAVAKLMLLDMLVFEARAVSRLRSQEAEPQAFANSLIFDRKTIELLREYPTSQRVLYEQERAKAVNRFTLEFLNEFADVNGGIDWEKLLRFNSARKYTPALPSQRPNE